MTQAPVRRRAARQQPGQISPQKATVYGRSGNAVTHLLSGYRLAVAKACASILVGERRRDRMASVNILGLGLSKTGTTALHRALGMLGLRSLHYDQRRLNDVVAGTNPSPDFHRDDDLGAVLDLPAACFFEELFAAHPKSRRICTLRNEAARWRSIEEHCNRRAPVRSREDDPFQWDLRTRVDGSVVAREDLLGARYRMHNARVRAVGPPIVYS